MFFYHHLTFLKNISFIFISLTFVLLIPNKANVACYHTYHAHSEEWQASNLDLSFFDTIFSLFSFEKNQSIEYPLESYKEAKKTIKTNTIFIKNFNHNNH